IYLDGSFESSTPINGNAQKDYNYLFIGRETLLPSSVSTKFIGTLDDYSIYNRSLTPEEIKVLSSDTLINLSYGLIAMYPFNGNANDESGNGFNGTVVGANLTVDRFGKANSAYYFDQVTSQPQYIRAPATYNSKIFSVSFWMKPDSDVMKWGYPNGFAFQTDLVQLYNSAFSSVLCGVAFPASDQGKMNFCSYSPAEIQSCFIAPNRLNFETWNHIVYTYDVFDKCSMYINGEYVGSQLINDNSIKDYSYLFIGREKWQLDNTQFKGSLDDYRVYNRLLTSTEIKTLYGDTLVNLSNGLIAMYPFNGNANDESGNNLNGTITGIVPFVNDRMGNPNKAIQLNGNPSNFVSIAHNDLFNFTSTTNFSISLWMYSNPNPNHFMLISKGRDVHSGYNSYAVSSDGFYITESFGQGLNNPNVAYYGSIKNSQWNHIVCIANSSNQKMYYYLNGNLVKDTSYTPISINNLYPLVFGRHFVFPDGSGGAEYPFTGYLDDISIYKRALNPNEIKALYGDNSVNLNSGLIAMYPFNGNANDE
ncbi:MAG: LamG domain-containing protein, partial [Cytophagales bacterium]|nr:LamG domain-containing protein [Cytophagales bacterium]